MDTTTELAIRAILNALHLSGAIEELHVASIVAALQVAAGEQGEAGHPAVRTDLMELAKGITGDAKMARMLDH